ncbi:unnamed protein product, partial [Gulo gulo]
NICVLLAICASASPRPPCTLTPGAERGRQEASPGIIRPLRNLWARPLTSSSHSLTSTDMPHLGDSVASCPHRNLMSPHFHGYIPSGARSPPR